MNYFISDTHCGHENVLGFDSRPFKTIEEHDKVLIDNWNGTVSCEDHVYILGDISWHNSTKTIEIFEQLNGYKTLIRGNHDSKVLKNPKMREQFVEITDYKELTFDDGGGLVLCHYPILAFKNHYYNWVHFYGHVHTTWEYDIIEEARRRSIEVSGSPCNMINVGCMMPWMNYTPKTFTEIMSTYKEGD